MQTPALSHRPPERKFCSAVLVASYEVIRGVWRCPSHFGALACSRPLQLTSVRWYPRSLNLRGAGETEVAVSHKGRRWVRRRKTSPASVGMRGFEPPTSCSQSRRATRLRYTPILSHACFQRPGRHCRCLRSYCQDHCGLPHPR